MRMMLPPRCPRCSDVGPVPCVRCASAATVAPPFPTPRGLATCRAAFVYDDVGRDFIASLKYRNCRAIVPWLVATMHPLVHSLRDEVDVVTWAPASPRRRRERGFDQAELLARGLAVSLQVPPRRLLRRTGQAAQTGRSRSARLGGPGLVVRRRPPPRVLLVDDVITTGATMTAGAAALRRAGALTVDGIAAAHTTSIAAAKIWGHG